MYKHILVAVDDSQTSKKALHEAIKLAKEQRAKLRFVYVVDEQFADYSVAGIDYAALESSAREDGKKVLDGIMKIANKSTLECDTQLIELKAFEGRIEEKIVDAAKKWPADLLVIGTHGRRGFNHFLLGSVAEGVARIAPIPVLLIRGE